MSPLAGLISLKHLANLGDVIERLFGRNDPISTSPRLLRDSRRRNDVARLTFFKLASVDPILTSTSRPVAELAIGTRLWLSRFRDCVHMVISIYQNDPRREHQPLLWQILSRAVPRLKRYLLKYQSAHVVRDESAQASVRTKCSRVQ